MPIVGFNLRTITASVKEGNAKGNVEINSTPTIEAISKKQVDLMGSKEVLSIEFKFVTKYEPKIGEILMSGEVLYTGDMKKVLSLWKEKKLDSQMAVEVLNVIFRKCLTKAVLIADEMRLPLPLTFPTVGPTGKKDISAG